jgi:hypothetical protein
MFELLLYRRARIAGDEELPEMVADEAADVLLLRGEICVFVARNLRLRSRGLPSLGLCRSLSLGRLGRPGGTCGIGKVHCSFPSQRRCACTLAV